MRDLFRGPRSLTYRGERMAFIVTLLLGIPAAGLIGFAIHEEIGVSQIMLFLVIAIVYVTLARGRLVGSSVRLHETQNPRVFAIVKRCAAALELPMPLVFVREDYLVPVLAVGLGEPYSLILSSHWIEHFQEDELAFMVGRELGHIASGHTRLTSLLSVNGNENTIVSLIFGAWLRRTELTCDRVGLLCCGSIDVAMRAIAIASFHHFGRQVDYARFAEQSREVNADTVLRLGELIGSMPYATRRIDEMRAFFASERYRAAEERLVQDTAFEPVPAIESRGITVTKRDCAGWWRRFWALAADLIIVVSLVLTFTHVSGGAAVHHLTANQVRDAGNLLAVGPVALTGAGLVLGKAAYDWPSVFASAGTTLMPVWIAVYFALLVGLAGQTPGMMITALRVVRTDFRKPGLAQAAWRYTMAFFLWWLIVPLSPFSRVYLHDKYSGTRLIKSERVTAQTAALS